jgi:hypothetical protein
MQQQQQQQQQEVQVLIATEHTSLCQAALRNYGGNSLP